MAVDSTLLQHLRNLSSANVLDRRNAEAYVKVMERSRSFSNVLLQILESQSTDYALKYPAAIVLCNFVKNNWAVVYPEPGIIYEEKCYIKEKVPQLAIMAHKNIASFLRDIVKVIVEYDTIDNFPILAMVLSKCGQFADFHGNLMVLELAHSIFKKYRLQIKSETLWLEIRTVLNSMALNINCFADLLFNSLPKELPFNAGVIDMDTIYVFCRLLMRLLDTYHDLIYQELPEEFVQQIDLWMSFLYKIVTDGVYGTCTLSDCDKTKQITASVTKVKLRAIRILNLFIAKYEADVRMYIKGFVLVVYRSISNEGKVDEKFSSACIEFFNRIVSSMEFRHLISSQDDIRGLCTEIVKPYISLTEYDYEMFDYSPGEFINKDMDRRSDASNRKAVMELISNLMSYSENLVTSLFCNEVQNMIALSTNGSGAQFNVRDVNTLDTAIFLLITVLTKKRHPLKGVLQLNSAIKLSDYFENLLCPILLSADRMHPLIVADALKFIYTFYRFVNKELLSRTLPVVLRLFSSEHEVVFTYICMILTEIYVESKASGPVFYLELIEGNLDDILHRLTQKALLNEYCCQLLLKMILYYNVSIRLATMQTIFQQLTYVVLNIQESTSPSCIRVLFECVCLSIWVLTSAQPAYFSQLEASLLDVVVKNIKENNPALVDYYYQVLGLLLKLHSNESLYHCVMLEFVNPEIFLKASCASGLCIIIGDYVSSFKEVCYGIDAYQHLLTCFRVCLSRSQDDRFSYIIPKAFITRVPFNDMGGLINQVFVMYSLKFNEGYNKPLVKGFVHLILQLFYISDNETVVYMLNNMGQNFYFTFLSEMLYSELIEDLSDVLYKKLVEMVAWFAISGGMNSSRITHPKLWCDILNGLVASVFNNKEILIKSRISAPSNTEGDTFNRLTYSALQCVPFSTRVRLETKFITTDIIKNFDIKRHLHSIVNHPEVFPSIQNIMAESNKKYLKQLG